ncbi:hypothetical protein [Streptomonospora wellingtoniae]|uniref:Secreted protein n=1 Tax=Streptomonospora wellingtoniae TaxID=3075544 RepID=A0ABU2KRG4_9ACTN|nr:hypothetical protein [Streptomonospora sp. DSM 45055]MDT0301877.1 hypothetical protein [Streptomonospora sp. DSM 45055]
MGIRTKSAGRTAAVLPAVLALLAAGTPTAAYASDSVGTAASADAAQAGAGCRPMAGAPYRVGTTVKADVSSYGCTNGWTFRATLQSSRWDGWATDDTARWFGSTSRVLNDYDCGGVHDHRVLLGVESPTGFEYPTKVSRTVRIDCG